MSAGSTRYATSVSGQLGAVGAMAGGAAAAGGVVLVVVQAGRDVLMGMVAVAPLVAGIVVMVLWALRRLTEYVDVGEDGFVYSVLGRRVFIRFSDVVGVSEMRTRSGIATNPQRLFAVATPDGRRTTFSSYIAGFNDLVGQIRSRIGDAAHAECPPPKYRTLVNIVAVIIFILCMAALAWALWLNSKY